MTEIRCEGQLYAVHDTIESIESAKSTVEIPITGNQENTSWYGDSREAIQASRMCYNKNKAFKAHKHILRPRLNNYTQECLIIYKGLIQVNIYSAGAANLKEHLHTLTAKAGDIIILYRGYHDLKVLEDNSIFFEIKNGEFTNVEEDKCYL